MSSLRFIHNTAVLGAGMALCFHASSNVSLIVADSHFFKNNLHVPWFDDTYGGGLHVLIADSQSNVTVQNTEMVNNTADSGKKIFFQSESTSNVSFSLLDSNVRNQNSVSSQAGVKLKLIGSLTGNILIRNTRMTFGSSTRFCIKMKGMASPAGRNTELNLPNITIEYSTFNMNQNAYHVLITDSVPVLIRNCNFSNNSIGDAVITSTNNPSSVTISNCTFFNNSNGVAVIAVISNSRVSMLINNCTITDNSMTGLLVVSGHVRLTGHNVIQNRNKQGAGIHLSSYSYITVEGTLALYNNTAETVGRALLQTPLTRDMALPSHSFLFIRCATVFTQNSSAKVIFSGNSAKEGGSDMGPD